MNTKKLVIGFNGIVALICLSLSAYLENWLSVLGWLYGFIAILIILSETK